MEGETVKQDSVLSKIRVVSFDIFDTLVQRTVSEPADIFDLCGKKLREIDVPQYFCTYFRYFRTQAEIAAIDYACEDCNYEVSIDDIYSCLHLFTGIEKYLLDEVKKIELETEFENWKLNNEIFDKLSEAFDRGEKVILISDMYIHEQDIRNGLVRLNPIFAKIPIYVSCDCNANKNAGNIFFYVKTKEKCNFDNWIHYGDNETADGVVPSLLGINSIVIGTEKEAKKKDKLQIEFSAYNDIGYKAIGPFLLPFLYWILQMSEVLHADKICFIARDGDILKQCMDSLLYKLGISKQTFLLYGSRRSWQVDEPAQREMICQYVTDNVGDDFSRQLYIDTNSTETSPKFLADILGATAENPIRFLDYLLIENHDYPNLKCYCFSHNYSWIEQYCVASYGTTLGYKRVSGKIVPLLQKSNILQDDLKRLTEVQEGILLFFEEFDIKMLKLYVNPELSIQFDKVIQKSDDPYALSYFGSMLFADGDDREYAPILSMAQTKAIFLHPNGDKLYQGTNLQYSIRRSSDEVKNFIDHFNKLQFSEDDKRYLKHVKEVEKCFFSTGCKKVTLIGAGKNGEKVARSILLFSDIMITEWADSFWRRKKIPYAEIVSIDTALKKDADLYIITVQNNKTAIFLKNLLEMKGIDSDKILTADSFLKIYMGR